jgi:hypothetical protein
MPPLLSEQPTVKIVAPTVHQNQSLEAVCAIIEPALRLITPGLLVIDPDWELENIDRILETSLVRRCRNVITSIGFRFDLAAQAPLIRLGQWLNNNDDAEGARFLQVNTHPNFLVGLLHVRNLVRDP